MDESFIEMMLRSIDLIHRTGDWTLTQMRSDLLAESARLVTQDRNNVHGPPHQDFTRVAGILTAMGFRLNDGPIASWHVAMILAALKLSRLVWNPLHRDNWVDLAGYAACGAEAAILTHDARQEAMEHAEDADPA